MSNPVSEQDFEGLIGPLGSFEAEPVVAIAVSGGRDSMALAFLVNRWVRSIGGRAVLLTVDHDLRPESADEAQFVADWAKGQGLECQILRWRGEKPKSAVQSAARTARYALMEDGCRRQGILHLFLAHHADDQGETLLMRMARGSGPAGLSAMAPVTETRHLRLLRPLLTVSRQRLEDTLAAAGMDWVEDPSNQNPKYDRTLVRQLSLDLKRRGLEEGLLSALTGDFSSLRQKMDAEVVRFLGRYAVLHPAGYITLPHPLMAGLDEVYTAAILGRVLRTVGGGDYAPGRDKLARLRSRLADPDFRSATLGRCRITTRRKKLIVLRESRNLPPPYPLAAGEETVFDERFLLSAPVDCRVAPLGLEGWKAIDEQSKDLLDGLPSGLRGSLPAFWDDFGLLAAPSLRYWRGGLEENLVKGFQMSFRPPHPLCGIGVRLS